MTIDPRSYARYDGLADTLESMDPANLARLYSLLKPRMRDAYRESVTQRATSTPRWNEPWCTCWRRRCPAARSCSSGKVFHAFRDPALERLSPAQKQLLRMGPRNVLIVKDRLREIAGQLGIPAERLPAVQQD